MNTKITNYFSILPGNNSIAIQRALEKRAVWKELPPEKDYLSATFHWQQLNYAHKIYDEFNELSKFFTNKHVHFYPLSIFSITSKTIMSSRLSPASSELSNISTAMKELP
jgi:hypothetical protein